MLLCSGVDHEEVARRNPNWNVNDWCWYWERDLIKALRKADIAFQWPIPGIRLECGEDCVCIKKRKPDA